ncbi:MAG TPA: FeoB-associated Cys-rich membrane protein [Planctomycetaceae bacterium]|nr:FeoB-associated Cys-rich membrane protein [Planctomycetaceae bacterium]
MIDSQLVIVGLCVVAAAAWLIGRIVRELRGSAAPGCGSGCTDCSRREGQAGDDASEGFVSVDQLLQSPPRKG